MTTKQRMKNFKARLLGEENKIDFHLKVLLYLQMDEEKPNRLQFKFLIAESWSVSQDSRSTELQDINRHCHTILVIIAPRFEETQVTSFKGST